MKSLQKRVISLALIALAILSPISQGYAAQDPNPPKFKIVIVEGDGAINNVKQRLAREVIVQVEDENDRPIGGVAVAFLLPSSGPGGLFSNGTGLLNVTTNAAGRATAQFVPNSVGGTFQINVSASFQGQVSTAVIPQTNSLTVATTAAGAATGAGTGTGISATTIALIAVAVAAAVAVGVAAGGKDSDQPAPTSDPTPGGAPTIRIGPTGTPTAGTPGFQQAGRMRKPVPKWR